MFKLVPLALLTVLPGCPLLDLNVAVDDLCVTQANITVPASPLDVEVSLAQDFKFDNLDALHQLAKIDGNVMFKSATIKTSGNDLSSVASAHLTLASDDASLPTLDAFDCTGDCFTAGSLDLTAIAQQNVLAYMSANVLTGSIQLDGSLPTQDWTMDVTVCLSGSLDQSVNP